MENNIFTDGDRTIIMNGGNPLPGCPTSWEEAKEIEEALNSDNNEIKWRFDCGFKLDFDGGLLTVSSRFYPPKTHYGKHWDGGVELFLFGNSVSRKQFICDDLQQLKSQVDEYIASISSKIEAALL